MKNKVLKVIIYFAVFAAILASTGCSDIKDLKNIRVTPNKIESFRISGLKAADAVISVSVDNPAKDIVISEIHGTVEQDSETIGTFFVEPLTIAGRSESTVTVNGRLELVPDMSPLRVMSIINNSSPDAFTVTVSIKVKCGKGASKRFTFRRIPVSALIMDFKK